MIVITIKNAHMHKIKERIKVRYSYESPFLWFANYRGNDFLHCMSEQTESD